MNAVELDLEAIAPAHHAWVDSCGWHNITTLESVGLIGSEIGEAAAEALQGVPTDHFAEELSDIVLRILDLAVTLGIMHKSLLASDDVRWETTTLPAQMCELMKEFALWTNSARKDSLDETFTHGMSKVLSRTVSLADNWCGAGVLADALSLKIEKNRLRGTRGRTK